MSKDRKSFYTLTYKATHRPMYFEDIGQKLKLSGLLWSGMGENILLLMPEADVKSIPELQLGVTLGLDGWEDVSFRLIKPSLEEWAEILRISDDPLVYVEDETGLVKAFHRKCEAAISGGVQQRIWQRDGFLCLYCGIQMGDAMLTIDHFEPEEHGGASDETNLISSCRACNKRKGDRDPQEYCEAEGLDYDGLRLYLSGKAPASFIAHLQGK